MIRESRQVVMRKTNQHKQSTTLVRSTTGRAGGFGIMLCYSYNPKHPKIAAVPHAVEHVTAL